MRASKLQILLEARCQHLALELSQWSCLDHEGYVHFCAMSRVTKAAPQRVEYLQSPIHINPTYLTLLSSWFSSTLKLSLFGSSCVPCWEFPDDSNYNLAQRYCGSCTSWSPIKTLDILYWNLSWSFGSRRSRRSNGLDFSRYWVGVHCKTSRPPDWCDMVVLCSLRLKEFTYISCLGHDWTLVPLSMLIAPLPAYCWGQSRVPHVCSWMLEDIIEGIIKGINEGRKWVPCQCFTW